MKRAIALFGFILGLALTVPAQNVLDGYNFSYDGGFHGFDAPNLAGVDPQGNAIVISITTVNNATYVTVAKFDVYGTTLLKKSIGLLPSSNVSMADLDGNGNLWLGVDEYTGTVRSVRLIKVGPAGSVIVDKTLTNPISGANTLGLDLNADRVSNNIYVALKYGTSSTAYRLEMMKFGPTGNQLSDTNDPTLSPQKARHDSAFNTCASGKDNSNATTDGGIRCGFYNTAGIRLFTLTKSNSSNTAQHTKTTYSYNLRPGPTSATRYLTTSTTIRNTQTLAITGSFICQKLSSIGATVWTSQAFGGFQGGARVATDNDIYIGYAAQLSTGKLDHIVRLTSAGGTAFNLPFNLDGNADDGANGFFTAENNSAAHSIIVHKFTPAGALVASTGLTLPGATPTVDSLLSFAGTAKAGEVTLLSIIPISASDSDIGVDHIVLNPKLKSVSVSSPITGGKSYTGIVTLNSPAPSGGANVLVFSENPNVLFPYTQSSPLTVHINPTALSATFPVVSKKVSGNQGVTIDGELADLRVTHTSLLVPCQISSVGLPPSFHGGSICLVQITFDGPNGTAASSITVTSDHPTVIPNSTIPVSPNASTLMGTIRSYAVATTTTVKLSFNLPGQGLVVKSISVTH